MKKLFILFAIFTVISNVSAQNNVGIGTNSPITTLDVNGAYSTRASTATASTGSTTIPDNISLFELLTGSVTTTLSVTTPYDGQFLTIINQSSNTATFKTSATTTINIASGGGIGNFIYVGGSTALWYQLSNNSTGATSFTAGSGLSWSTGPTLNSNWTSSGTSVYPSSTSSLVGIGNATPGNNLLNVSTVAATGGTANGILLNAQSSSAGAGGAVTITGGSYTGSTNSITPGNIILQPGAGTNTSGAAISGGVGIGNSSPNSSAILDLTNTTSNLGFLPPSMTTAQRNAINSPAAGLMVYNTDDGCYDINTYNTSPRSGSTTGWQTMYCPCPTLPTITILGEAGPCPGATNVTYQITPPPGAISYTWSASGALSITNTTGAGNIGTIATVPASGTFNVSVTVTNACGATATASVTETVNSTAPATPGITQPTANSVCPGATNTPYSVTSPIGGITYTWGVQSGVGASITSTNPATSVSLTAGTSNYAVSVTATNSCNVTSSNTVTTTLSAAPSTPGITQPTASTVCPGTANTPYSITSPVAGLTYTWAVQSGIGASITSTNPATSVSMTSGTTAYTVSVTATNGCGQTSSATATTNLLPIPTSVSISGSATGAISTSGNAYSASSTNGTSYTWAVTGSGNSVNSSGSVTWGSTAGTYNVNVTATDCSGTASATQSVVVSSCTGVTQDLGASATITYSKGPGHTAGTEGTITTTNTNELIVVYLAYASNSAPPSVKINGTSVSATYSTGDGDGGSLAVYGAMAAAAGAQTIYYSAAPSGTYFGTIITAFRNCAGTTISLHDANAGTYNTGSGGASVPTSATGVPATAYLLGLAYDYGTNSTGSTTTFTYNTGTNSLSPITEVVDGNEDDIGMAGSQITTTGTYSVTEYDSDYDDGGFYNMFWLVWVY